MDPINGKLSKLPCATEEDSCVFPVVVRTADGRTVSWSGRCYAYTVASAARSSSHRPDYKVIPYIEDAAPVHDAR